MMGSCGRQSDSSVRQWRVDLSQSEAPAARRLGGALGGAGRPCAITRHGRSGAVGGERGA